MKRLDDDSLNKKIESKIFSPGTLEMMLTDAEDIIKIFNSNEFHQFFINRINCFFNSTHPELLSVDVFDTLLIRNNKSEPRRFYEISYNISEYLSKKLKRTFTAEEVLIARYISTHIDYRFSKKVEGCREGSLIRIHKTLCRCLGVAEEMADKNKDIEIEYEKKNLSPNKGLWEIIKKIKSDGARVILLCDMYIHKEHIESLIEHFWSDYKDVISEIISSADYGISKFSGLIYPKILKKYKIKPSEILHIGDNFYSDFYKARQNGINAIHLPKSNLSLLAIEQDKTDFINEIKKKKVLITRWIN